MKLNELTDLYEVDRRVLYGVAQAAMWGAHKKNGAWYFESPPFSDYTMSVEAVAKGARVSRKTVRQWCRESSKAKAIGQTEKIRAIQVGRTWKIHFEDGARLIVAQLGGYRKHEHNN